MNVERGDGLAVAVFTQRMKASLTQEELAAHAGLSTRTIRNVEAGITPPQPHPIKQLAQALQIDLPGLPMVAGESGGDAPSSRPRSDGASAPLLTPAQLPTD